jgi:DNA-binding CsgD family transcriptional regulator
MSLGPTAARKRTSDLAEFIRAGAPKGTDVLEIATRELAPILGTQQTLGTRFDVVDGGVSLVSVRSPFDGASRVERSLRAEVETQPRNAACFDPTAPDPAQRNVVLSLADLQRMTGRSVCSTPVGQLLLHGGFSLTDVARTLLCDGPVLLAWFGAFRDRPFDGRERSLLCKLVRPLREMLTLQGRLATVQWAASAMKAALSSTGAATLVFRRPLRLLHCNPAARALLESDRAALLAGLQEEIAGRGDGTWIVQRLSDVDGPEHYLAMRRTPPCDPGPRAALALTRMGLTRCQGKVLELLAQGHSNRAIAVSLSCSGSAVEQHVTTLLRRYDVEGRAELVARFWTDTGK